MNKSILGIIFLLFMVNSCAKKQDVLVASVPEEYTITYYKDSIVLNKIDKILHTTQKSKFLKRDLGYYFVDKSDTTLCLSVLIDTVFINRYFGNTYKTKIERIYSKLFRSSSYYVDSKSNDHFLTSYYYDNNYKIVKFEKAFTVDFVPK